MRKVKAAWLHRKMTSKAGSSITARILGNITRFLSTEGQIVAFADEYVWLADAGTCDGRKGGAHICKAFAHAMHTHACECASRLPVRLDADMLTMLTPQLHFKESLPVTN